jgi:transcriptional regulator with XRE-family HTH domain
MHRKSIHTHGYQVLVNELRTVRERHGWTQSHAAHVIGCSRSWLGKVERCELRLDVIQFIHICRTYGISTTKLLQQLENDLSEEGLFFTYQTLRRHVAARQLDCTEGLADAAGVVLALQCVR